MAQPALDGPEQIDVPQGYSLIEVPATFMTIPVAALQDANTQPIFVPPTYKTTIINGVKIRREIIPAVRGGERSIKQPFETKVKRVVKHPIKYNLANKEGKIIKRWHWMNGKLVETN